MKKSADADLIESLNQLKITGRQERIGKGHVDSL